MKKEMPVFWWRDIKMDYWRQDGSVEKMRLVPVDTDIERLQNIEQAADRLVRCKGRFHAEQNYRALAELFGVTVPTDDGWILASERKPEPVPAGKNLWEGKQYLLEWDDGHIDAGWWMVGGYFQNANGTSEGSADWDGRVHQVVAWMELPRREKADAVSS